VEKLCGTGWPQMTNRAQTHFKLGTKDYKHTIKLSNNYWFSTATIVAWRHRNVTLYADYLSCLHINYKLWCTDYCLFI